MTEYMEYIERKEYEHENITGDELDAIDELSMYDESYICDAIHEISNDYTPVNHSDTWEYAQEIAKYAEDAISEGLTGSSTSIEDMLNTGYYYYYHQLLNLNVKEWAFNWSALLINNFLNTLESDQINQLDFIDIEDEIDSAIDDIDSDSYVSDVKDATDKVIEYIKESLGIEE